MRLPRHIVRITILKIALLVCLAMNICFNKAYGQQAKFLDLTISGNHTKSDSDLYLNTKTVVGVDLGIPMSSIFEIGVGYAVTNDRYDHTEQWRTSENEKIRLTTGISNALPPGNYVTLYKITDTSVNASLGYTFSRWRPYVFGGVLSRAMCYQSPYGMETPECLQIASWNAGVGIGAMLSASWSLKLSHRLSPSFRTDAKTLDQQSVVGLTWSL